MEEYATSQSRREAILAAIASITSIERGKLSEEYRESPAPGGQGAARKGPYHKHQCWEDGRNRSRRVPAAEVPLLREDLENGVRFNQLVKELASVAIADGRRRRASPGRGEAGSDAKKNSAGKACGKGTGKPKRSSAKSPRASKRKGSGA